MKATKIITVICWSITALVLTGLLIFFLTGTIFGLSSDKWDFGNFGIGFNSFTENLTGPFEVDEEYLVDVGQIQSLKVNWVSGNVVVKAYDGDKIQITELAQRELRDREKLSFSVAGDTLTVNFRERGGFGNMPRKQLEVLVPQGLAESLSKLIVNTVSGDVNVEAIAATDLQSEAVSAELNIKGTFGRAKLENVSGRIILRNEAENSIAEANTVSGSIDLSGTFNTVKIETVSGRMTVESMILPTSLKSDSVSGSLTIKLPADSTISVNHSAVSGKLNSELPVLMDGKGAAFVISSVSGSTTITVLE
ncbi:MAG: DUF4097 domain-containing protein [Oscillospiraceae bacterium]|nr:DUF4097 domain-containing protein [Oscillospiraceae bacterium]